MKRIIIGILIVLAVASLITAILLKTNKKEKLAQLSLFDDSIKLSYLSGSPASFDADTSKGTILVIFNSTCDDCQKQIGEISRYEKGSANYRVIFVSDEDIEVLRKFKAGMNAAEGKGMEIRYDIGNSLTRMFGIHHFPTSLIFDRNGKLLRRVDGLHAAEFLFSSPL
ncbi:TlpA family protein disulfide reductase [Chitinophaga vietnamensis]|uniref:TlpA family protein disulfide reductase n=1 Tax=Chitinophaga vietnamensis TaxID=2593957 RepID=UPI0011777E69|nr:redoxin domain-containing protein [Chitinophaga vietnamensis]